MKKRYVKRVVRKIIFFVVAIAIISLVTVSIVEKRITKNEAKAATDYNGDPVTQPFVAPNKIVSPRRPRPPIQDRNSVRNVKNDMQNNEDLDLALVDPDLYPTHLQLPRPIGAKRDWNDYAAMEQDAKRVGLGEHGMPAYITDESQKELEKEMSQYNGFNALLSDSISVNRSVPDVRKEGCRPRQYLAKLPTTSVVIPFFNEHFSVLLRTLYSIINRTPSELLKEIIVVDDFSDRESIKQQLDDYVEEYLKNVVKIVRLSERKGLIGARLAGARVASGDVLVFFDSHIECNYNWLPPLLEPIALNGNVSTCPIVDIIDHANFAYNGGYQEGSRGIFNWEFSYKQLPVLPEDGIDKTKPLRSPVMMGGLFAIGRAFFWLIGGYDDGLDIWGGEQYELSFKIWMCGGMLLDVPCSRVAHIFRGPMDGRPNPRNYSFVNRNHKRVAEVWMDEYKEFIYARNPQIYEETDTGDLTKQKAIRENLQCKPFKWFLEVVAPDLLLAYPPIEPPDFASGAVQNVAYPTYCLDTFSGKQSNAVGLYQCAANKTHPQRNQMWKHSYRRNLHAHNLCLDVQDSHANATVWMWNCHNQGGNQFWYYDRDNQWLVHSIHGSRCLEAFVENGSAKVYTNVCDTANQRMKWIFGFVNNTALDDWMTGLEEFE